jgi:PAS domain S-box-containing protein
VAALAVLALLVAAAVQLRPSSWEGDALRESVARVRTAAALADAARLRERALRGEGGLARVESAERGLGEAMARLQTAAAARGAAAAALSRDVLHASTVARLAHDEADLARAQSAIDAALDGLDAEAQASITAAHDAAKTRAVGAIFVGVGLLVAIGLVVAVERRAPRDDGAAAAGPRIDELERERRNLLRRLRLIDSGSHDDPISLVGRRIVAAVAEETGAPVVLLHVPPVNEPLAPEVVAAVGASSVGSGSPIAVREVLASGIPVAIPIEETEERERLQVRTSIGVVSPREVLLRPIRTEGRTVAVVEIGIHGPLDDQSLADLDALLVVAGQSISHALATEYAHRLSSEVRAQAATVAGVYTELDTVFESVADGLAVTDETGEIVRLNAAGRVILGVASLDDPDSRRSLADLGNPLLQALREGTRADGLEVALRTEDGTRRIIQVKISPLSVAPAAREAVAVFRDVTRERQLERDLRKQSRELEQHVDELERKQSELERATRLKSEFLANMSHELRTPLNAIIGFAEVLLDGTYGTLNAKQKDCARDVLSGGRHLLGLINDILDLSKIEAGKMELQREDLDLESVVQQAIVLVTPQAATKAIPISVDVARETHLVHGDPDRIRQILLNLLSNAVKFTSNGGKVRLSAQRTESGTRVVVEDTGIGIAPEHADRLFKEFSQVDGSHTRRFGGTGLGLAISKRLVELGGGSIGFESEVGKGSKFFFTLPRATQPRPTFTAPPPRPRSRPSSLSVKRMTAAPKKVLIVERDDAAARLVEGALREADLSGTIARSFAEARRLAHDGIFDAAVVAEVDDAAPLEVVTHLRDACRLGVVVTSIRGENELPWARGAGVTYVGKPIDRAALVEKVCEAIARKGAPRRAIVVDSGEVDGPAVKGLLEREAFAVDLVADPADAFAAIGRAPVDLIVTELDFVSEDGLGFVEEIARRRIAAIVVLTARALDELATRRLESVGAIVIAKGTLSRSAFAAKIAEALIARGPRRARVLAVDDNEQNLRLIGAVLARRGIEMLEASDATTAIAIAREQLPDAILMDVMLPDVDGLMATRELKSDPRTSGVPIIAVTANAMAGDESKARDAGCVDYVTKPIDAARLLRALDGVLPAA